VTPKSAAVAVPGPPPVGRTFRLTYSNSRPDEDPKLFCDRDAMAFCELDAALCAQGRAYATSIYLYPGDDRPLADFPTLLPSDLLVLTTRPPLHDQVGIIPPHRKVIRAAKTELEGVVFEELSKYFEFCTRKHVQLTPHAVSCLRVEQAAKWAHVEFYEYGRAEIQRHYVGPAPLKPDSDRHSTVAFFVHANRLPRINCGLVVSFGMDGYGTLIWNRLIRTRNPDWLQSPRFVMAELIYRKAVPDKPITPEFVDDGKTVEVRLLT
jgi:hypothetical protein